MSRRLTLCPETAEHECLTSFAEMRKMEVKFDKVQEKCVLWQTRHNTLLNRLPPSDNLFAGKTPPNRKSGPSKLKK